MIGQIHVIDPDYRRRAQIAHELSARGIYVEIYEDLREFGLGNSGDGWVFAADDEGHCTPAEIAQTMRASGPSLPIVMYGVQPTPERIVRAMLCGASDYLQWPFDRDLLDLAFRRVLTEGTRKARQEQLRSVADTRIGHLSPREREVLIEMVNGLSNKDIGKALNISSRTVEVHRGSMMRKLNARSTSDAVRIALSAGLHEDFQYAA